MACWISPKISSSCTAPSRHGAFERYANAAVNGRIDTRTGAGPITGIRFGNFTISNPPDSTPTALELRPFLDSDRFNFAPFNYFLTPNERYGGFLNFKGELSDAVNLRIKAVYNRRNSQNQAAFLPLFVGPDAGNGNLLDTISIDATNPFNPFGVTLNSGANGQPATYSFIARRVTENGQRTYNQSVDTWSVTGTLDGRFQIGGRDWYWDVNAVLGWNDAHQLFTGNINAARLAQALVPLAGCTGSCVPFNIFGGQGSITPAMLSNVAAGSPAGGASLYPIPG